MASSPVVVPFTRPSTAAAIQGKLKQSEQQIDLSFGNAGQLYGQLTQAAAEAGLHEADIHRTLVRAHDAAGYLLKARWAFQMVHRDCREHLKKVDTDVLGWGDTNSPQMSEEAFIAGEALTASQA